VSDPTSGGHAADPAQSVHPPSFERGEIGDAKLSAALRTLELTIKRKLDGVLQGNHLGLIPGPGSEPGESRMYQPGDDVRRMDWSVTARTTHPHVRQMVADRELETWLVVDMSASLDFGTTGCEKRDLAVGAAAAMTYLNSGGGNRIGAVIANGENIIRVPARGGRQHEQRLLRAIRAPRWVCAETWPAPSTRSAARSVGGEWPSSSAISSAPSTGCGPCGRSPVATRCSASRSSTPATSSCRPSAT
jgi:uncharacterized protein (DUF58 family)